jgi:Zn-finger protein
MSTFSILGPSKGAPVCRFQWWDLAASMRVFLRMTMRLKNCSRFPSKKDIQVSSSCFCLLNFINISKNEHG